MSLFKLSYNEFDYIENPYKYIHLDQLFTIYKYSTIDLEHCFKETHVKTTRMLLMFPLILGGWFLSLVKQSQTVPIPVSGDVTSDTI